MNIDIKDRLLAAGLELATEEGSLAAVTRYSVAQKCEVSPGCVSYHWKDMDKLRTAVVREAVRTENLAVIGQALGIGHHATRDLPDALRRRVAQKLATV